MKKSVFQYWMPKENVSRNPFPLDCHQEFSFKFGQYLPCWCSRTVPADKFKINAAAFFRTNVMNTAAFDNASLNFEFYHVNLTDLWSGFREFLGQTKDPRSSYHQSHTFAPRVSRKVLLRETLRMYVYEQRQYWKDLSNLITGLSLSPLDVDIQISGFNPFDIHGFSKAENVIRILDMLGYGNYQPVFSMFNHDWHNVLEMYKSYDGSDTEYINIRVAAFKRWFKDWYPNNESDPTTNLPDPLQNYDSKYWNLWPILAYNKVWSDYKRNYYFDKDVNPREFNVDDLACTTTATAELFYYRSAVNYYQAADAFVRFFVLTEVFQLHYVPWEKDLVTGLLPSPQMGDVSTLGVEGSVQVTKLSNHGSTQTQNFVFGSGSSGDLYRGDVNTQNNRQVSLIGTSLSQLDPIALKRVEAMQRYRQILGRAGFRSSKILEAVYGGSEFDGKARKIGSWDSNILIQPIEATSSRGTGDGSAVENQALGELAGKAQVSLQGDEIEFNSDNFGIIIGLCFSRPEATYDGLGMDPQVIEIAHDDYFNPKFDDLGLQAVPRVIIDGIGAVIKRQSIWDSAQERADKPFGNRENETIGFAPRFYGYKTGRNIAHGEFCTRNEYLPELENVAGTFFLNYKPVSGTLAPWSASRVDVTDNRAQNLSWYYVNPRVMDKTFKLAAQSSQKTDHLFGFLDLKVTAVRNMSVIGDVVFNI